MKYLKILTILIAVFYVTSSCKKADEYTKFNMEFDEPIRDVKISYFFVVNTVPIPFTTATESESQFHKHDTAKDLIEEINPKEAVMNIDAESDTDFSFLEFINFYLVAEGKPNLLIASRTDIPADIGKSLKLDVIDQDLSYYLKQEELEMIVEVKAKETVTEPFDMKIYMKFLVNAKILGI